MENFGDVPLRGFVCHCNTLPESVCAHVFTDTYLHYMYWQVQESNYQNIDYIKMKKKLN